LRAKIRFHKNVVKYGKIQIEYKYNLRTGTKVIKVIKTYKNGTTILIVVPLQHKHKIKHDKTTCFLLVCIEIHVSIGRYSHTYRDFSSKFANSKHIQSYYCSWLKC
jgi:hypothetical protein